MKAEYRFPATHVAALRELLAVLDAGGRPSADQLLLLRRITDRADRLEREATDRTRAEVEARRTDLVALVADLPEDDPVAQAVDSMEATIAAARVAAIPDDSQDPFDGSPDNSDPAAIIEVDKGAIGG